MPWRRPAWKPLPARRNHSLIDARREIESTRPTARNLFYAVERVFAAAKLSARHAIAEAQAIADEDAVASQKIGEFGKELIRDGYGIATHCNAGWLAFVDYGTALSPIYMSHKEGKKIFVYVDETRPRGQGARLTAWELHNAGIPHAIIPDNATAWYMSQGKINLMITGADRIAANGDTANKIGTLEKAIAAKHFNIPFYIAAPTSTFDMNCPDGSHIIIEERSQDEVLYQDGNYQRREKRKDFSLFARFGCIESGFRCNTGGVDNRIHYRERDIGQYELSLVLVLGGLSGIK